MPCQPDWLCLWLDMSVPAVKSRVENFFFRLTSGTVSLGDTAIDSRAVEVPPPERGTTLTLAVRSHECNVVLRSLAGYPIVYHEGDQSIGVCAW